MQAKAPLGSPAVQPSTTGDPAAKTADKKTKTDTATPDTDAPLAVTTPATTPPVPVPTPLVAASLAASPTAPSLATSPSTSIASGQPTAPAAAKAPTTSISPPVSAAPTSSRMADQAAAATQAGLSIDGDREDGDAATEPQAGTQTATQAKSQPTTGDHSAHASSATPVALPPSQLAIAATQAAPSSVPIAPTRSAASTAARTSDTESISQPSGPSTSAANSSEPSPAPTTDVQAAPPVPSPMSVATAAGSTAATQPTKVTSPSPSPAAQVAQAITEPVKIVMTSPPQSRPTMPHVTTIQITPEELGRVEIRIERTNDGPAKIQLVAERPETLSRLVHDQSQLQQALDHAGIPQNSRTIEFSLAPPTTDGTAFSSSFSGNNAAGGESPSNGSQRQNTGYYNQPFNDVDDVKLGSTAQSRIVRTGIDITA